MSMPDAKAALESESLDVAVTNIELAKTVTFDGVKARVIGGFHRFASAPLLRYSGYGALAKRATAEKRDGDFLSISSSSALLGRLRSKASQSKVYVSSGEFGLVAKKEKIKPASVVPSSKDGNEFADFLASPDAVYLDGAVQIRYLESVFRSKVVAFPNLLPTSFVEAYLLTRSNLQRGDDYDFSDNFSPSDFDIVIKQLWDVVCVLSDEVLNKPDAESCSLIDEVRRGFRHNMSSIQHGLDRF